MSNVSPTGEQLQDWLQSSTIAVHRDGLLIDSASLLQTFGVLAEALRPFRYQRIALASPQAEHIFVAIAAAQTVNCEILLLRANKLPEERARI